MGSQDSKKAVVRAKAATKDATKDGTARTPRTPVGGPVWKVLSVGTTLLATKLASDAARKGWKLATGRNVPVKGDYEHERTRDVVLFTALSSMAVASARVAAERGAATYYRRSAGHLPAALDDEKLNPKDVKAHRKLVRRKARAEYRLQKAINRAGRRS